MKYITEQKRSRLTGELMEVRRRVVTCCGEDIVCRNFTQTCNHCGADYNMNGSRLAPRSQWGEETGEHWLDCY